MDKPPKPGLPPYLDSLVEKLRQLVPAALGAAEIDAVHQARVATRRLTAAVDLYLPVIPESTAKPLRKTLKRLRRSLGPLRDLDVMLGHLADLKRSRKLSAAVKWLDARMRQSRADAAREAAAQRIQTVLGKFREWTTLRKAIAHCATSTQELLHDFLRNQMLDFASRATAMSSPDPASPRTDPHELRIAGKALRYTFEMADHAGMPVQDQTLRLFKQMQDSLGQWHDFAVLAEHALRATLDTELAIHDGVAFRKIAALASESSRKADLELDDFRKLWLEHGPAIQSAVQLLENLAELEERPGHLSAGASAPPEAIPTGGATAA